MNADRRDSGVWLITTHINADFDCLGSMAAARLLYPGALLAFSGGQENALRRFLRSRAGRWLKVARAGDIDCAAVSRLILVDVNDPQRLGAFADLYHNPAVEVHIYDHHPLVQPGRATLNVVAERAACVTLLAEQLQQQGLAPDAATATVMMLGLYADSGNLLFPATSAADYAAAAWLLDHGANLATVADNLTCELTAAQVELLHQLLQGMQVLNIHTVDVHIASASVDSYVGDIAMLAHKMRDMEGMAVLIVLVRLRDRVFMLGRSRTDQVDIGAVMRQFGGGGHAAAASATVRDMTLVQVQQRLPQVLAQMIEPCCQARQLMTAPVRCLAVTATMAEARRQLTRYNINALAVVDDCNAACARIVGIVTRQMVERALHHAMEKVAVEQVMSCDFTTATEQTPLADIAAIIMEKRQRFVPVLRDDCLVGVITRTDLLRHALSHGHELKGRHGEPGGRMKRRQILRLLDTRLPRRIRRLLEQFGAVADANAVAVYAVGGFVRDLLLGRDNLDLDIVVEGDGIAFAHAFAAAHQCRVRSHEKFATAVLIFADGFKVDVASARSEFYHEPGALPQVEQSSLKLDLYRRDFTINTMAIALNSDSAGELIDYFGAHKDLHDGVVRVLHNLSFVEDPTRAYRAVRFEQRFGFRLGLQTERLLRSAVTLGYPAMVSRQRLFNELMIILNEEQPWAAVERLQHFQLLGALHPRMEVDAASAAVFALIDKSLNWYELLYRPEPVRRDMVYLLYLCRHLDDAAIAAWYAPLSIPQRWKQLLGVQRRRYGEAIHAIARRPRQQPSRVYHLLEGISVELVIYFMAVSRQDEVRAVLSDYIVNLRVTRPLLNGNDLRRLGVPAGPVLGQILTALLDARLDGAVRSRADEEQLALRLLQREK